VAILGLGRRKLLFGAGAALAAGSLSLVALWPSHEARVGYPFARRALGQVDPMWSVAPAALVEATTADAARLARLLPRLDGATARLEKLEPRLANAKTGELTAEDRAQLRDLWWQVFEPILAVDELKSRYAGWYGIDYIEYPKLHARSFALSFTALCAEADAGLRLLAALEGKPLLPVLFDEAMPEQGLPAHTFSGLRKQLARVRDLLLIPVGNRWYERWIAPELRADQASAELTQLLEPLRQSVQRRVLTPTTRGVSNELDLLQSAIFQRWFPVQRDFATWAGDTRVAPQDRRLISDAQLGDFKAKLEPGDIILERRNWYLSNIGLPGFWPHAALFVGTQAAVISALAAEPDVKQALGDLSQRFSQRYPKAWASLAERDEGGHERCVIEAVSEGVSTASLEHSCAADYVAALRPRVSPLVRARAIERALAYWGRPYDFNFDFATDDEVVCSELVMKAYESSADLRGLNVPYVELLGRRAVPPTEFARAFRDGLGKPDPQLDFVYFLEGRENGHQALVADATALATSCDRPKWDIVQP